VVICCRVAIGIAHMRKHPRQLAERERVGSVGVRRFGMRFQTIQLGVEYGAPEFASTVVARNNVRASYQIGGMRPHL